MKMKDEELKRKEAQRKNKLRNKRVSMMKSTQKFKTGFDWGKLETIQKNKNDKESDRAASSRFMNKLTVKADQLSKKNVPLLSSRKGKSLQRVQTTAVVLVEPCLIKNDSVDSKITEKNDEDYPVKQTRNTPDKIQVRNRTSKFTVNLGICPKYERR